MYKGRSVCLQSSQRSVSLVPKEFRHSTKTPTTTNPDRWDAPSHLCGGGIFHQTCPEQKSKQRHWPVESTLLSWPWLAAGKLHTLGPNNSEQSNQLLSPKRPLDKLVGLIIQPLDFPCRKKKSYKYATITINTVNYHNINKIKHIFLMIYIYISQQQCAFHDYQHMM